MLKRENKSQYIGFSYFKNVLWIKNLNFEFECFFSESKKKNDNYNLYFNYSDKSILNNSLHNVIFLLKHFEKDFFSLNQCVLKKILETIDLENFIENIKNKPNSEFLRKIWFLLETILKIKINFWEDFVVKKGYINILNEEIFLVKEVNRKDLSTEGFNSLLKIIDNSLWEFWKFNPIIIKKNLNSDIIKTDFNKNLENINSKFDKEIIEKAINYLYTKETKGSLEIEWEKFHQSKNRWFLKLISNIPIKKELTKKDIINFYNIIYNDNIEKFRDTQNYIGSWNWMMWENIIEYIPPKSEDLEELMESLIKFYNKNKNSLNPIILSSILSIFFVLIHPFLDWNGRTSRFLFQYSLLNSWIWIIWEETTVSWMWKIILPVSAFIQLNKSDYYKNLENISWKLLDFIDFDEDYNWEIKILNKTKIIYSNLDFTEITNYFYEVLNKSINIDYKKELNYINKFYTIYSFIDQNYNIISNNISFITKNIISNNWILSTSKKKVLEKKWVKLSILEEIEEKVKK